ncbi:MAG: hypothetical protein PVH30_00805 [Desulfobacterales bacterium]|jgi:hypothetical protein
MANSYLVDCHDHITGQMALAERRLQEARDAGNLLEMAFCEGQVEEWRLLRRFLSDHFDLTSQRYY